MNDNKALERVKRIIAALKIHADASTLCAGCYYDNGNSGECGARLAADAADLLEQLTAEAENEPLTLDKLRGMDGEPVWVEQLNGDILWGTYSIVWLTMRSATNGYVKFPFDKYSKTWLAYRRKPDGGGE